MHYIDLTHNIHEQIPLWPGSLPFSIKVRQQYSPRKFRVYDYHLAAGTGTHLDAPFHCKEKGKSVAEFSLNQLIGPGCVIDVSEKVQTNPDYVITAEDIECWEKLYGKIAPKSIVIAHTGWSQYWPQPQRYCNADAQGVLHFPGFGEAAARLLVTRDILGVGIDTLSLDPGNSQTYAAHHVFLGSQLFQLENLANTAVLPAIDATIFVLPLKIEQAPEAPARVFAMLVS